MTVASLTREIEAAREEFNALNGTRWEAATDGICNYPMLPAETEAHLVALAQRITRLCRFRVHLFAKTISSPPAEQ